MANFITTFSKLTGPTDYPFWEIYIKSTLAFIIYPGAVFTADNMLNALALSQTTNVNNVIRRECGQTLGRVRVRTVVIISLQRTKG